MKGIIFDMDGVLVLNMHIHTEAFRMVCAEYGVECTDEMFRPTFGKGNDEIIPILFPQQIIEQAGLKNIADQKEATYRRLAAEQLEPAPGLVKFLEQLRAHGIKCAVGSSGPTANVEFVLEKCGIAGYFDAIASGDMVRHAKPDPEVFLLAAKLLGLPAAECIVIEDAFAGIEAARAAGTKVIAMTSTNSRQALAATGADLVIDSFLEIDYAAVAAL